MNNNILENLARASFEQTQERKLLLSEQELDQEVLKKINQFESEICPSKGFRFFQAIIQGKNDNSPALICECKKASPSKGVICDNYDPGFIARAYQEAKADAISVLCENSGFQGSVLDLKAVCQNVSIPVLRKDFITDPYQVKEAFVYGADAVLLIVSILDDQQLKVFLDLCLKLHLDALVECHDLSEIRKAIQAGARIIGVNNRNLKDFSVDCSNSLNLRNQVPDSILFVSESGFTSPTDIEIALANQVDAVLIGEALMKSDDKIQKIRELKGLVPSSLYEKKLNGLNLKKATPFIKLCGIQTKEDVDLINQYHPDRIGFILAPRSRRSVSIKQAQELSNFLDPTIEITAVFLKPDDEDCLQAVSFANRIQIHQPKDPEQICRLKQKIKIPVIEAFGIRSSQDLEAASRSVADEILLDASCPGSGKSFNWNLLKDYDRPFILAGGIDSSNIQQALSFNQIQGIDLASSIESMSPEGNIFKDQDKIETMMKLFKKEIQRIQDQAINPQTIKLQTNKYHRTNNGKYVS
ncbi:indole-3-glycerol phosphate synthase TrpC [Ileibacterium valens]|uniref:indole-3-glycerol phosphate synthase TrpC n=1 Tax=Ileibacterium valens TaxID=1862668 RepID=UPI0024B96EBC|nr:indole-3-glycerol phosphate synthase TrpC [Ileibacterium valens]